MTCDHNWRQEEKEKEEGDPVIPSCMYTYVHVTRTCTQLTPTYLAGLYQYSTASLVKDRAGEHNYAAQSFAETSQRGQVSLKVQLS